MRLLLIFKEGFLKIGDVSFSRLELVDLPAGDLFISDLGHVGLYSISCSVRSKEAIIIMRVL